MLFTTPYFQRLRQEIAALGGGYNAHLHLDRAGTLCLEGDLAGCSQISLAAKHALIPSLHASASYAPQQLRDRGRWYLDALVSSGTTRAATLVDVTADRVGLSALEVYLELRRSYAPALKLEVGAYSPLGFRDSEPERWQLLEEATGAADFIGSLPERDDQLDYPEHIGFSEHCRRMLDLADHRQLPLHIHLDQRHHPGERGTECLMELLDQRSAELSSGGPPRLWLIHVISPSTYPEERFQTLLAQMGRHQVGVICCPSAAISMNQLRRQLTPTGNSIARVLEMLVAGIPVRVGSDNINDITSPAGCPDLLAELFVLCHALRFFDIAVLAHLAAGRPLDQELRERIRLHLEHVSQDSASSLRRLGDPAAERSMGRGAGPSQHPGSQAWSAL